MRCIAATAFAIAHAPASARHLPFLQFWMRFKQASKRCFALYTLMLLHTHMHSRKSIYIFYNENYNASRDEDGWRIVQILILFSDCGCHHHLCYFHICEWARVCMCVRNAVINAPTSYFSKYFFFSNYFYLLICCCFCYCSSNHIVFWPLGSCACLSWILITNYYIMHKMTCNQK